MGLYIYSIIIIHSSGVDRVLCRRQCRGHGSRRRLSRSDRREVACCSTVTARRSQTVESRDSPIDGRRI